MTMTIPSRIEEINIVTLNIFTVDISNKRILIDFNYGYRAPDNSETVLRRDVLVLSDSKFTALLNATPPGNKTFKQWIRPLIYAEIASHLGVPVGQID